jgi:excisionase family DNA binding protein
MNFASASPSFPIVRVTPPAEIQPLAVDVIGACRLIGLQKTTVWELIRSGAIPAKRYGRRTLIPVAGLQAFLNALPNANQEVKA